MSVIDICFAIHDLKGSYCKYLGVAIMSIQEMTRDRLRLHILCDETLSEINKKKLVATASERNDVIEFYCIDATLFDKYKKRVSTCTIGTLFRFLIPELLPNNIEKVIYLDADILVRINIGKLWKTEMGDSFLAACYDMGMFMLNDDQKPYPCLKGIVEDKEYFNAGVMVLNLKRIRQWGNLLEKAIAYLEANPGSTLNDQDALNVLFRGNVIFLSEKYNISTRICRNIDYTERKGIFHFSGDVPNPHEQLWFDRLFYEIWERSHWWNTENVFNYFSGWTKFERRRWETEHAFFMAIAVQRPICLWGAYSKLNHFFWNVYGDVARITCYVDSNAVSGDSKEGIEVRQPESLLGLSERPFVIVMSNCYFDDISKTLAGFGYVEHRDFIDGAILVQGGKIGRMPEV